MQKKNTGGTMKVVFANLTEAALPLTIKRTAILKDVLAAAQYEGDYADVRVNGREAGEKTKIHAGDFVSVVAQVSGGAL
jgi:molybdopterin converting factor small subunit